MIRVEVLLDDYNTEEDFDIGVCTGVEEPDCAIELDICGECYGYDGSVERSNRYLKKFAEAKAFKKSAHRVESIRFYMFPLDDWEPFLTTLQQAGANIKSLELKELCFLTEKGALLLGDILKTATDDDDDGTAAKPSNNDKKWRFNIKEFKFSSLEGSTAWIDGFLQNKTITHLNLSYTPVLNCTIQFILNSSQLEKTEFYSLTNEERDGAEEEIDFFLHHENEIHIGFATALSLSVCKSIGCLLRQTTNLKELSLLDFKASETPYDFMQDAIHCNKLDLSNSSDFDLNTLVSLINGDRARGGNIKHLALSCLPNDTSKVQHLPQRVDFSMLDSFELDSGNELLVDSLCRELAKNKGPKWLLMNSYNENWDKFASKLASSLIGNDKIERLEFYLYQIGRDPGPKQQLLHAMSQMPRLKSWKISSPERVENQDKWVKWTQHQLESNWNIQTIDVPFDLGNDTEDMLTFNKLWPTLLHCHDQMSFGIWPLALSRTKSIGVLYRVICQVPNLFQQVADEAGGQDAYKLPSFVVPHHSNCPACRKQRRQQVL